ncbi:MAG: aminodeoxychorismate synthase component I [Candidatus Omnitrophica bacterium]|nr:aminodeoxychorismate synthase component I [Candidatus Omnitrophota bacterium]
MKPSQDKLNTLLSLIEKKENCVLLWTDLRDRENQRSLLFTDPQDLIIARRLEDVESCFDKIQSYLRQGLHIAGYLSYEASFAFEERFKGLDTSDSVLMWFGVYRKPKIIQFDNCSLRLREDFPKTLNGKFTLQPLGFSTTKNEYKAAISKIKSYIAGGHTYQVNYTIKKYFRFSGSVYNLFLQLCRNQKVSYAAFIKNNAEYILSLSPELFFSCKRQKMTVRPMKGTINRGKDASRDCANAFSLKNSYKDRAENIMIVDLLRNDLGRVSKTGSVNTTSIFDIQKLNTLWQMTSTVKSHLESGLSWLEVFRNIFPSGSVTGAPKIRTMEIIHKLESTFRGVYTGSIGYIAPGKEAVFNVAIRTLRIDRRNKLADLGIGSGIIWDSKPEREWQECLLKADFLKEDSLDFQLIETMVLRQGEIALLEYHLERLEESTLYFDFCFKPEKILYQIKRFIKKLKRDRNYKLRLLLFRDGYISLTSQDLTNLGSRPQRIIFSRKYTNSGDSFLFHKTTKRALYNSEHAQYRKKGYFDCIFKNEKGEITEGAISNIFIEKDSKIYTPALSCGLLNGVYRRYLFATAKSLLSECVLHEADIYSADNIYLTNAIYGIIKIQPMKRK